MSESTNKGCRVSYCSLTPKFEVMGPEPLRPILACRNHLTKAIEEFATDDGVVVKLNPISDLEYLQVENKRLRRRLRELENRS